MPKICSKPQNKARIGPKFVHGQKDMIFCNEKSFWKGVGKSTHPGTQALKNLPGPIGLSNCMIGNVHDCTQFLPYNHTSIA